MGLRESKISFFPYEEVQRRGIKVHYMLTNMHVWIQTIVLCSLLVLKGLYSFVFVVNEDELKRLRLAFKRIAGASGVMGKSSFFREVLGESVPPKLAEV